MTHKYTPGFFRQKIVFYLGVVLRAGVINRGLKDYFLVKHGLSISSSESYPPKAVSSPAHNSRFAPHVTLFSP